MHLQMQKIQRQGAHLRVPSNIDTPGNERVLTEDTGMKTNWCMSSNLRKKTAQNTLFECEKKIQGEKF